MQGKKKLGKIQGIYKKQEKSRKFVVLNSFSASLSILILKIFWGSMPPESPKQSWTHIRI